MNLNSSSFLLKLGRDVPLDHKKPYPVQDQQIWMNPFQTKCQKSIPCFRLNRVSCYPITETIFTCNIVFVQHRWQEKSTSSTTCQIHLLEQSKIFLFLICRPDDFIFKKMIACSRIVGRLKWRAYPVRQRSRPYIVYIGSLPGFKRQNPVELKQ